MDYLKIAVTELGNRKMRSWLTILGIVIGIAAIVSLISIAQGLEEAIRLQVAMMGSRAIVVTPGRMIGTFSKPFTESEIKPLESIRNVEYVVAMNTQVSQVAHGDKESQSYVAGISDDHMKEYITDMGLSLEEGSFIRPNSKHKAIVGSLLAKNLEIKAGDKIIIYNHNGEATQYRVAGVLSSVGSSQDDNSVMIKLSEEQEMFQQENQYQMVTVMISDEKYMDSVADDIEKVLSKKRDESAYQVMTPDKIIERVSVILGIVEATVVGIAAISLLVGVIGIMNTMYMSILERTKQIGVMKAIGAKNNQIMMIFITESAIIGVVGGVIGMILGFLIAYAVEVGAAMYGYPMIKAYYSIPIVGMALIISVGVGVIAGLLPARRAAKLNPVDALRWE
ncbi:MAG TPA: ABC transporter permease [Candidatus Aenigmarchaeota archaeon]|nr:ABC transporter permease [Candidatus Aenigmarchaeota archaeon]HEX32912.1 ABC transporter permease [Candidatus Aenigmarchaeota archaeon]